MLHNPQDKVTRTHKRVEDMHIPVPQRLAELLLQNVVHRADHKLDNRLGGVNNAVRVGHLDRKALEELLVDRVQKVLLLGKVANGGGGGLDGPVEAGPACPENRCG